MTGRSSRTRIVARPRCEADALEFRDPAVCEAAFDDFVAHEGEDPVVQEKGPRIAVPVHAGSAAAVVGAGGARARVEGAEFAQLERLVTQVKERGRLAPQLLRSGAPAADDGQAPQPLPFAF